MVLEEFALMLQLQDVYRSGEGQLSVEAVSLTTACLGLAASSRAARRAGGFDRRRLPSGPTGKTFAGVKPSQPG